MRRTKKIILLSIIMVLLSAVVLPVTVNLLESFNINSRKCI